MTIKLITVEQVARLMHCHPSTIYRWVRNREIPFIKKGRRVLFTENDIEAWLDDHKIRSTDSIMFKGPKIHGNEY